MADPGFVHLHVHSSYSLLEGALTDRPLAELAKADRQPALALTDTDNMFGALEFSEKLAGAASSRSSAALSRSISATRSAIRAIAAMRRELPRLVLLAAHEEGYRNLMRLSSRAFLDTPSSEPPHLKLAWLEGETGGLIALTGGPAGRSIGAIAAGQADLAAARCERLARAVRRPALCRAAAPRHCRRSSRSSRR